MGIVTTWKWPATRFSIWISYSYIVGNCLTVNEYSFSMSIHFCILRFTEIVFPVTHFIPDLNLHKTH